MKMTSQLEDQILANVDVSLEPKSFSARDSVRLNFSYNPISPFPADLNHITVNYLVFAQDFSPQTYTDSFPANSVGQFSLELKPDTEANTVIKLFLFNGTFLARMFELPILYRDGMYQQVNVIESR